MLVLFPAVPGRQADGMSSSDHDTQSSAADAAESPAAEPRKGPLSFLSGSITSLVLAWLSWGVSKGMVTYFAAHPPYFSSPIAQNIATALKTLLTGLCFLATFSFGFIGLGLFLVFLRSLFTGDQSDPT